MATFREIISLPFVPLTTPPSRLNFPPGTAIRIHVPGFTGSRGYINDDGTYVIVGAEREEDDGWIEEEADGTHR